MTPIHSTLSAASDSARAVAATAKSKASRLSLVRLVVFFAAVALIIVIGSEVHLLAGFVATLLALAGFNKLVGKQQALDLEVDHQERRSEIAEQEIQALNYDFTAFANGEAYQNSQHPYISDLDIFGKNSVFQQLNRTGSLVGKAALAAYMREPLNNIEYIEQRQAAVAELAPLLDWRVSFAAYGSIGDDNFTALDKIRDWAAAPIQLQESWWTPVIVILALFNLAWLGSFFYLPFYVGLLGYAPSVWLLHKAKPQVDIIHKSTEQAVQLLGSYQKMIGAIEERKWETNLLRDLATVFKSNQSSASESLAQLAKDSRQLALRVNPFILLLNLFSFWEIRYARRLEAWKSLHLTQDVSDSLPPSATFALPSAAGNATGSSKLDYWFVSLGAFDALSSFAAASYRSPQWTTPGFTTSQSISGLSLKHPLLPPERSVGNDFECLTASHIKLLTGSNMAGKSTFLRTVGLNIVMAHWGCNVPAIKLSLPLLSVFTSMRTQDNLHEGASAFYAELQRLRVVVEATKKGDNIFFLLDEILKGTNSQDRHEGGRALIEQLIRQGGAGIVATHDLELGEMAQSSGSIDNIRLEVETDAAGQLYFDYTVKAGLAQSRNASILMKQMGLGTSDS